MRAHERLIFPDGDDTQRPEGCRCDCGAIMEYFGPGQDYSCEKCGLEYNSSGQQLAPRSQWGEETGEIASDFDRGVANPSRAFDED